MVKVETLDSILEFFQDKDVQEKAAEVGRLFFTNGSVTVNLIPILLFSFLGSLCKYFHYLTSLLISFVCCYLLRVQYFALINLNLKL